MLTTEQLHAIMPKLPAAKGATLFPFLTNAITEFNVEPPARTAAFLAQLAHESGEFRFMEELWGPTPQQQKYEPPTSLATTLGNTQPGDGKRFKGRGPIQVTGRSNYRRFGDLLGIDLVANPARAAEPDVAFRIAGLFWAKKGLNELADRVSPEAFKEITRRINGGFHGLEARQRFYQAAMKVLGVIPTESIDTGGAFPPEESAFDRGFEAIAAEAGQESVQPKEAKVAKAAAAKAPTARKAGPKNATAKAAAARRPAGKKPAARKPAARSAARKAPARGGAKNAAGRNRRGAKTAAGKKR